MKYFIYMCIGGSSSTVYTGDDSTENSKWNCGINAKPKLFETKEEAEAKQKELQHGRDTEECYYTNGESVDWAELGKHANGLVCVKENKYPNCYY